ncbi:type II secretion system F family protein [Microbacterium sp.]|uniref:type II secretion system F family protein n=1 Tax=Microbacterium sp. TaxID=51671 RepID=UPI0039E31A8C
MSPVTVAAVAVVFGSALACGILLAATRVPRWAAPSLQRRIAPYVRDVTDPGGLTPLAAPALAGAWRDRLERMLTGLGGAPTIARRLRRAGWSMYATAFRARQLAWALAGLLVGGAALVALTLAGRFSAAAVLLPAMLAVIGAVLCDMRLARAARRRAARIEEELPTVLEFLGLCLAAGEGLLDALHRVGEVGAGELTDELRGAVLATRTGSNLRDALTALVRELDVAAVSRSIDHVVAAIDRGAPLAQVLQAQAADAREDAKRGLIEQAGRKEIVMLVPLVFLVLPLSVLVAVFPGIVMLRLGLG